MLLVFKKDYLSHMYETGESDKSPWFQPEIVKKYIKVVNILKQADSIEKLFFFNSLNYEKLKGDKAGIESVRIDNKYHLEFQTEKIEKEVVVTICNILEITNHYK